MKLKLAVLIVFATFACHAQGLKSWPDACGKDSIQFKVKTEKSGSPAIAPETGKAKIVFVEVLDGDFMSPPTTRMALNGSWVGADRGDSYFAVSVDPGMQHLCASRQSSIRDEKANVGLVNINAEAGKVYFYESKVKRTEIGSAAPQGGNSLPGQYPGSMTAKSIPQSTLWSFKEMSTDEFQAIQRKLALGISNVK